MFWSSSPTPKISFYMSLPIGFLPGFLNPYIMHITQKTKLHGMKINANLRKKCTLS